MKSKKIIFGMTWEDYSVDREALKFCSNDRVVTITSGGCNVLNTALENPKEIITVDRNPFQNNLLRDKIDSIRNMPYLDYIKKFFFIGNNLGVVGRLSIVRQLAEHYCGSKALNVFFSSDKLSEQKKYYHSILEPKLWNTATKNAPLPLMFFWGVHPRQIFYSLIKARWSFKSTFKSRFDRIFTHIPINKNYFWQQILLGQFVNNEHSIPYLKFNNFSRLKKAELNIKIKQGDITDILKKTKTGFINKFNLSDTPEFMNNKSRHTLWSEVIRSAVPHAKVVYRSFAPDVYPPKEFGNQLKYNEGLSEKLTHREMTGCYNNVYAFDILK